MRPSEAMRIMENPEDYTVQERKDAKRVLKEYGPKTAKDKTTGVNKMAKGGNAKKKDVPVLMVSIGMGKAKMHGSGKANGKEHKYAAGGSVTDKLPNTGLRKLASTPKGKQAVRNMGFDV